MVGGDSRISNLGKRLIIVRVSDPACGTGNFLVIASSNHKSNS
ncbi:DNA methyltransferase [Paenibacillus xylanilyticus]